MSEIKEECPFIINSEEPKKYTLSISNDNYINCIKNFDEGLYEANKDKEYIITDIPLGVSNQYYLSNHFNQLPYGLIDKSITGLGATTLEMKAKRNSIIVTPTKNLAYSKYSKDPKNYLYVGRSFEHDRIR